MRHSMHTPEKKKTLTAPIVCGAVYRRVRQSGIVDEAIMQNTRNTEDGTKEGTLVVFGYSSERFREGDESFVNWEMVATPTMLDAPVSGSKALTEEQRLRKELDTLRKTNTENAVMLEAAQKSAEIAKSQARQATAEASRKVKAALAQAPEAPTPAPKRTRTRKKST